MTKRLVAAAAVLASAFTAPAFLAPASATVGSASVATLRQCDLTPAGDRCDGTGPGQGLGRGFIQYAGGTGVAGPNLLAVGANRSWSDVAFDAALDLPTIRGRTEARDNVRMNINVFAFQSYVWNGVDPGVFSISGDLHIVDSSVSVPDVPNGLGPGEDLLGGTFANGAIYTAYVGIWDPGAIAGLTTPQDLFNTLFYAGCGTAGVLGAQQIGGSLFGGEGHYSATTSACSPGSLTLNPGQEVLVVVGMQLPVNRGGWVDASSTFTTGLGKDLDEQQIAAVQNSISSAISTGANLTTVPEPASWAMLIAGFGLTGAAMRRRRTAAA